MILHYYEKGKKGDEVILFIHGSASDATIWLKELSIVAAHGYHCIALDLRGHGETKDMAQPLEHVRLDIETHLHDITETLEYLGLLKSIKEDELFLEKGATGNHEMTIVSHSFGGVVAIDLAERYPNLIEKLILVALPPKLMLPVKYFLEFMLGKPLEIIQRNLDFIAKLPMRSRYKSSITTNAHVLKEIFNHVKNWSGFKKLPKLKSEVFFAAGRFDYIATAMSIYRLYQRVPGSKFKLFKWSSHAIMEDEPLKFQHWLMDCIRS